jgi:hypothetical protein
MMVEILANAWKTPSTPCPAQSNYSHTALRPRSIRITGIKSTLSSTSPAPWTSSTTATKAPKEIFKSPTSESHPGMWNLCTMWLGASLILTHCADETVRLQQRQDDGAESQGQQWTINRVPPHHIEHRSRRIGRDSRNDPAEVWELKSARSVHVLLACAGSEHSSASRRVQMARDFSEINRLWELRIGERIWQEGFEI